MDQTVDLQHLMVCNHEDQFAIYGKVLEGEKRPFEVGETIRIGTQLLRVVDYASHDQIGEAECEGEIRPVMFATLLVDTGGQPWPYLPYNADIAGLNFMDHYLWAIYRRHRCRPLEETFLERQKILDIINPIEFPEKVRKLIDEAFPTTGWPEHGLVSLTHLYEFEERRGRHLCDGENGVTSRAWNLTPKPEFYPGLTMAHLLRHRGDYPPAQAQTCLHYFNVAYGMFSLLKQTKEIVAWMSIEHDELGGLDPEKYLFSTGDLRTVHDLLCKEFTPSEIVRGVSN